MVARLAGFGCMRLSTERDRDEARAVATLCAALDAGATLLDTAPSYGQGEGDEHHNERLIAGVLGNRHDRARVEIATKGGLVRRQSAWVADGRAKSLIAACEASLRALCTPAIDLYFLHAPDPKTPIETSVRALESLRSQGLIRSVGLSNISLGELERARRHAEIGAIQVALGAFHDEPLRSGLVQRAIALGIRVVAHSPLGGPRRARALARDAELMRIAAEYETTPAAIVLAWLYGLDPLVVPIPGATRPESARQALLASRLQLGAEHRAILDRRFQTAARVFGRRSSTLRPRRRESEIVVVMGIQGAGKSAYVEPLVQAGHQRLNRDQRGGTLRGVASELGRRLSTHSGPARFVLDNTYPTRASRSHVLDVAREHGVDTRCVWLDTPLEQAQINSVLRLIERYGRLPEPDELKKLSRLDPNAFVPTVQFRFQRDFEAPSADEGFGAIEVVPFARRANPSHDRSGIVLSLDVARAARGAFPEDTPVLVFGWAPETPHAALAAGLPSSVELAVCSHPAGPPSCWCRPPLPGLLVPWMLRERVDPKRSLFVSDSAVHERMARALGFDFRKSL